jgi:formylglycine-generating enzyme required for sulfatase activity
MRKVRFAATMGALCGITFCALLKCSSSTSSVDGFAGNSTLVGNPVVAGLFFGPDGMTPVPNAAVYIRSCGEMIDPLKPTPADTGIVEPNSATTISYTDGNGRYAIDSLDTGMYVIEATSGNNRALIDSVHITETDITTTLPPHTLKPAGAIKGEIYLAEGGDAHNVFVLASGMDRFAQVNTDGTFIFKGLAEGNFDLRIIPIIKDYGVIDTFGISVKSADTTDVGILKLPHMDILAPTNLQIGYDTLRQAVQLAWTAAATNSINGYTIYRAAKGQKLLLLTQIPLSKTTTTFIDTAVNVGQTYRYCVVSRMPSGEESHILDIDADTVMAVSSSLATTTFTWTKGNTFNDTTGIGDTVLLIVNCVNPTRAIDSIYWFIESADTPLRVTKASQRIAIDTMRIAWPSMGAKQISVYAKDAAKTGWADTIRIYVIRDTLQVTIDGDTSVHANAPMTFQATTYKRFGTIARYEWKFGPGQWISTLVPQVQMTAPSFGQFYACSLRVSASHGNSALDAMKVLVVEHQGPLVKIIAAGQSFQMGEAGLDDPVHQVTFTKDFWMDTTEVEQTDFLALMGFNPSKFKGISKGPVEGATWFDAVLFCNARSKRDGLDSIYAYTAKTKVGESCTGLTGLAIDYSRTGYRLPTEAEWEYACRSGAKGSFYWGDADDDTTMGEYAWFYANSGSTTHPVAGKQANYFGLYDLSGNVEEWCNDWFGDYSVDAQQDPTGPISGSYRVLRGGSWDRGAHYLRSASRTYVAPSPQVANDGFRLCRRVP